MKKVFTNTYYVAAISIILIVAIVALTVSVRNNAERSDATGQAYEILQQTTSPERTVQGPGMIKTYTETEPTAYAYLRDD
ncbi:MAG: hypothetical protein ACP5NV_06090 [Candidatus Woesearchaeota archaeon]